MQYCHKGLQPLQGFTSFSIVELSRVFQHWPFFNFYIISSACFAPNRVRAVVEFEFSAIYSPELSIAVGESLENSLFFQILCVLYHIQQLFSRSCATLIRPKPGNNFFLLNYVFFIYLFIFFLVLEATSPLYNTIFFPIIIFIKQQ